MSAAALLAVKPASQRCRHRCRHGGQPLPVRYLSAHPQGDPSSRAVPRAGPRLLKLATRDKRAPRADRSKAPADTGRRDFCRARRGLGGGLLLAMTVPAFGGRPRARAAAVRAPPRGAGRRPSSMPGSRSRPTTRSPSSSIAPRWDRACTPRCPCCSPRSSKSIFTPIRIVAAPAGDAYVNAGNGGQVTGTSNSVTDAWDRLRTAGAQGAHAADCRGRASNGASRPSAAARATDASRMTAARASRYGQLAQAAAKLQVPKDVALKPRADFTLIGTSQRAARHAGQGGRQRRVRPGREAAGHAVRRDRACPGARRAASHRRLRARPRRCRACAACCRRRAASWWWPSTSGRR